MHENNLFPDFNTIKEAFSLLGLSIEANEEEVKQATRELSKKHHPDIKGGDKLLQAKINNAKIIALKYLRSEKAIILQNVERSLTLVDKSLAKNQAIYRGKETTERLKKQNTNNLTKSKYIAWTIGAIAGMVALLGKEAVPLIALLNSEYSNTVKSLFTLLTLILGICGFYFQWKATNIQNQIDEFASSLSNNKTCANHLSSILKFADHTIVDESKVTEHGNRLDTKEIIIGPFRQLLLPEPDLSEILLQKSIEHGLLEEIKLRELTPDALVQYKLTFKPSHFKPQNFSRPIPDEIEFARHKAEKNVPEKKTEEESKNELVIFTILLLLTSFGVTWLAINKPIIWLIIPLFLLIGSVVSIIEANNSWKEAKKKIETSN